MGVGLCLMRFVLIFGLIILLVPGALILVSGILSQIFLVPVFDHAHESIKPTTIQLDGNSYTITPEMAYDAMHTGTIILIAVGASLLVHNLLGQFSVCCSSPVMLFIYAFLALALSAAGIWISVKTWNFRCLVLDTEGGINEFLIDSYNKDTAQDGRTQPMDLFQQTGKCCGVKSKNDWYESGHYQSGQYPFSCCGKTSGTCTSAYEKGCAQTIEYYMELSMKVLVGVVFGLTGLQCLVTVLAIALGIALRRNSDVAGFLNNRNSESREQLELRDQLTQKLSNNRTRF